METSAGTLTVKFKPKINFHWTKNIIVFSFNSEERHSIINQYTCWKVTSITCKPVRLYIRGGLNSFIAQWFYRSFLQCPVLVFLTCSWPISDSCCPGNTRNFVRSKEVDVKDPRDVDRQTSSRRFTGGWAVTVRNCLTKLRNCHPRVYTVRQRGRPIMAEKT